MKKIDSSSGVSGVSSLERYAERAAMKASGDGDRFLGPGFFPVVAVFAALVFLAVGARVDASTELLDAAWKGDGLLVEELVKQGANVNAKDASGVTPLMYAASRGNRSILGTLLGAGADVNASDSFGLTALMFAASRADASLVGTLIKAGADVNASDSYGWTALMIADNADNTSVSDLLRRSGAR